MDSFLACFDSPAVSRWVHRPTCASLRAVFVLSLLALAFPASAAESECAECHEVDHEAFESGVHGFLDCVECHTAAEEMPHGDGVAEVDCSMCHDDVVEEYRASVHGQARLNGTQEAPWCESCHGTVHQLLPSSDEQSPVHPARLPETCGACHANPEIVEKFGIPVAQPLQAYQQSVHARVVAEHMEGASCSSCHGSHAIFDGSNPLSRVNHQRVPDTCGQCHSEITEAYVTSVHGRAVAHGMREAPVCTDCHGEHRILSPEEAGSPVSASNVPKMTCGRCHGDLRLAEKYGLLDDSVTSYEDSYHGLASRSGSATVAHCGSCHGVHDILPSSDPASYIHVDNLSRTCGKCHPGAGTNFAIGDVHVTPKTREHAAVYYIRVVYLWLIYLTIGGMVLHNLLDLYRKAKCPPLTEGDCPEERERMSRGFRIAHLMLMTSFIVLAYTGFALKYPEAWWAKPMLLWEGSLGLRGWLHRASAVIMLGGLGFHALHVIMDRRARACILEMCPTGEDVKEVKHKLAYLFGRRETPPHAPWLGYPEKMEYLALMWGIFVMAASGFLLWFDDLALRLLPKWATDVATVIHFYEAILATLAIIVWHFYFVIFDPVVYPMDTAWLTGRSPTGRILERNPPSSASSPRSEPAVEREPPVRRRKAV